MAYGPQGQILSAAEAQGRNTNSVMQGWVDRGPWQYWDTIVLTASAQVASIYSPFSVPVGQLNPLTSVTKTKLETNMRAVNSFPPPRCLLLIALGFYISSQMVKADIDKLLDSCYIEFRIDDKIFHEGQLWQFPPGAGLQGETTQTGQQAWHLGLPAPAFMRRYQDWSKYIAPLQQISFSIIFPGTPPTLSANAVAYPIAGSYAGLIIPFFDGLTDRSVQ